MSYYGGGGGGTPVPLSDAGDLLTHDGSGLAALPVGDEGQALVVASGAPAWVTLPSSSPTTAEGDLIVRGAAADEALPVGDEGQVLAVSSGVPAWVTLPVLSSVCDARLTLTQGVPVTTSDVVGASTIYLTRYQGAHVALWDGSAWVLHEIPSGDVSLALSGLTAGKVYDVFLRDAAGTLTLSLSAAWADNVTRTDALAVQDGIRVLASDHTRRLVGTICATGTDTTEDSQEKRFLCNEAHLVQRIGYTVAAYAQYSQTGGSAWRLRNGDAAQIVQLLAPPQSVVQCSVTGYGKSSATAGGREINITADSTSTMLADANNLYSEGTTTMAYHVSDDIGLSEGYHYIGALEYATPGHNATWSVGPGQGLKVMIWQ